MSAIGQLQLASHGGIQFPYTDCRARIEQRYHAHVYIHTSGGEVEKLGLALRKWTFQIPAHDTLQPPFRNFYSTALPQLWKLWESGATAPAVIPNVGTVQAFATDAQRTIGRMASGEAVELSLLEDSRTLETLAAIFKPTAATLPVQLRAAVTYTQPVGVPQSMLDKLITAVDQAMTYAAAGDVAARKWTAKINSVISQCDAIGRMPVLLLPQNFQALDVLLELHATAIQLRADALQRGRTVNTWPTPTPSRMTSAQVAIWIHGDTSRAGELLSLNDWPDPLNVPRGSRVRFYFG